ncbi:hypothetical protein HF319_06980 [Xanthomonas sp. Kuri4-1]
MEFRPRPAAAAGSQLEVPGFALGFAADRPARRLRGGQDDACLCRQVGVGVPGTVVRFLVLDLDPRAVLLGNADDLDLRGAAFALEPDRKALRERKGVGTLGPQVAR